MKADLFDKQAPAVEVPLKDAKLGDLIVMVDVVAEISPTLKHFLQSELKAALGEQNAFRVVKCVPPAALADLARKGQLRAFLGEVVE